jgi:hypothetical protein
MLAALPHVWPDTQTVLPPKISNPAVGFEDGAVRLGAHYTADRWQAIVSLGVRIDVSVDGRFIELELSGVHGGSLPVPQRIVQELLDQLLRRLRDGGHTQDGTAEPFLSALREVKSADELLDGVQVKNRFVWFNGDRPFRIDAVTIDRGQLRLQIEPL